MTILTKAVPVERENNNPTPAVTALAVPSVDVSKTEFMFSSDIVVISEPAGVRAESIRTLRTYIMAQHVQDGRKGLAVCAPSAGVGATFTSVNLAVSLASIGVRTLLVDGNLRTPGIDGFIQAPRQVPGLRHCLGAPALTMDECIQLDVMPDLSVMYSGGPAPDPQELIASERFRDLMDRCLRDFDLTIIDTPPTNMCADARRISTVVGYSLIVARRNLSFISDLSTLESQLNEDRAKVVGTVLNEA